MTSTNFEKNVTITLRELSDGTIQLPWPYFTYIQQIINYRRHSVHNNCTQVNVYKLYHMVEKVC